MPGRKIPAIFQGLYKMQTEPKSPCVKVCEIDHSSGLCRGCWRTLDEIAGWLTFTSTEKREVLQLIESRKSTKAQEAVIPSTEASDKKI